MLELRPTCEHCNKSLPPDSLEARICTYECTFCATCVDSVFGNVGPNCGGICSQTNQTVEDLQRRQLPWQGSSEHQGQAQAGRSGGPCTLLGCDQNDTAGEAIVL